MEQETKTTPAVEVWRPVRNFEGLYEVSNLARVRSLDVVKNQLFPSGKYKDKRYKGQVLKQQKARNGYWTVKIKRVTYLVHRLVAEAFVPNPDNLPCINHKDEDKSNNLPSNLEWCDTSYNNIYNGRSERVASKQRKPIEQLTLDGQHVAYYEDFSKTPYCSRYIHMVLKGTRQTAYGYRWRYI